MNIRKEIKILKSSSKDIRNILEDFNSTEVDAVILDLRNNGGGALIEANRIIGLLSLQDLLFK